MIKFLNGILSRIKIASLFYWVGLFVLLWQINKIFIRRITGSLSGIVFQVPDPYFILVLFVSVVILLLIFFRPLWGLYSLFFLSYVDQAMMIGKAVTIYKVLGPFLVLLLIARLLIKAKKLGNIVLPHSFVLLLLFLLWGWISLFWAEFPKETIIRGLSLFYMIGFIFLTLQLVRTKKQFKGLIFSYVAGSVVFGLMGLYQFVQNPFVRASGFGKPVDAGHYAMQLFLAVFFFFIIAVFTNKKAIRWLALSAFVLFVMCGLLSGTRVFPICLLIGLFIVLFSVRSLIRGDKEFKKRLSSFALVIIFLSVFLISSAPFLFSRVGSFFEYFSFNDTSISFSEKDILRAITGRNVFTRLAHGSNPFVDEPGQKDVRYAVWDVYRKGFLDYYLFGVGLGNSNLYFGNIVSEFGIEGFPRVEAAGYADVGNDYYRVLIELGVVGLMIFLFFLWQLMREFYIAINKTSIYSPIWQMGVVIEVNFIVLLGSAVFWPMLNRKYFWFAIALLFTYIVVVEFMSLRGNNK